MRKHKLRLKVMDFLRYAYKNGWMTSDDYDEIYWEVHEAKRISYLLQLKKQIKSMKIYSDPKMWCFNS